MVNRLKNFGNWWPNSVGIGLFPMGVGHQLPKVFILMTITLIVDYQLEISSICSSYVWTKLIKSKPLVISQSVEE